MTNFYSDNQANCEHIFVAGVCSSCGLSQAEWQVLEEPWRHYAEPDAEKNHRLLWWGVSLLLLAFIVFAISFDWIFGLVLDFIFHLKNL